MKCYLPFRGELGWYLFCFVKKFHADQSPDKIICCKPGHECLFPTASKFFYDWDDVPDNKKAGVSKMHDEQQIMNRIHRKFGSEMRFSHLAEVGWHNVHDYAQSTFIPQSKHKLGLKTDVVITPRNREIDAHRNWTQEGWQKLVDSLVSRGITVGVCGNAETSFQLENIAIRSYDHIDIDSDVELLNNAKLVLVQESGMQYLSFLCERPTFCIDHYHRDHGADLHRNQNAPFNEIKHLLHDPILMADEVEAFLWTAQLVEQAI